MAGIQLPETPLLEGTGSDVIVGPTHKELMGVNCAVTVGVTTTASVVAVVLHCPASGVKVYVVLWLGLIAGSQLPVTPFTDVCGRAAMGVPAHTGLTAAKTAVALGLTAMVITAGAVAHCPAFGVKV